MPQTHRKPQENPARKTRRAALATTPYEDAAMEAVAQARGIQKGRKGEGYASLLRVMSLDDIVSEYERLKNILSAA